MINKATEYNDVATMECTSMDDGLQKIRECVVAHNKAIQFVLIKYTDTMKGCDGCHRIQLTRSCLSVSRFFNFLDATNRMNFLLQVGLNMIGISVTAFQVRDDSPGLMPTRGTDEHTDILFHRRLCTWMT